MVWCGVTRFSCWLAKVVQLLRLNHRACVFEGGRNSPRKSERRKCWTNLFFLSFRWCSVFFFNAENMLFDLRVRCRGKERVMAQPPCRPPVTSTSIRRNYISYLRNMPLRPKKVFCSYQLYTYVWGLGRIAKAKRGLLHTANFFFIQLLCVLGWHSFHYISCTLNKHHFEHDPIINNETKIELCCVCKTLYYLLHDSLLPSFMLC